MKFALLGGDETTLQIAAWIEESDRHAVHAIYDAGDYEEYLLQMFPDAETSNGWEALLLHDEIDAVVVGPIPNDESAIELRANQLRKLFQESVPVLMVHPACESILAFELEMIRTDTKCPCVSYVPSSSNGAFQAFCEIVKTRGDEIGNVEQVLVDRYAKQRDRHSVLKWLATDTVLLQALVGDAKSVIASGVAKEEQANLSNLSVSIQGANGTTGRWSISPAPTEPRVEICAVGTDGNVRLTLFDDVDDVELSLNSNPLSVASSTLADAIASAVDRLERQIQGERVPNDLAESFHALEVVDAVLQSCRRGRSVELLSEQPTEEDTFKAIMAAGGCGMLMWVLFLMIVGPLIFLTGSSILKAIWYSLLIVPIVVFLALQFLRFVFERPAADASEDASNAEPVPTIAAAGADSNESLVE